MSRRSTAKEDHHVPAADQVHRDEGRVVEQLVRHEDHQVAEHRGHLDHRKGTLRVTLGVTRVY